MTQHTTHIQPIPIGQSYPIDVFFMKLKLGLWTDGWVEHVGYVKALKDYVLLKKSAQHLQYSETLMQPLRINTNLYLTSLSISCKNNVWDSSSIAIAVFCTTPLTSTDNTKETAVQITASNTIPFINLFKKYQPKDEYPVIEIDDVTVTYNGAPHSMPIKQSLTLQYFCLESRQTSTEAPTNAGKYIVTPVGHNDIGAKLTIQKAKQTINFDSVPDKTYGDPDFCLFATASSGLSVTFNSNDDAIEIEENNVKIRKAGEVTISAQQQGNPNYEVAPAVSCLFTIAKAQQQITQFDEIENKYIKDPCFDLLASSSSGIPVTFSTPNTDLIDIDGKTITLKKTGQVTIIATQNGDDRYNAAEPISKTFVIEKGLFAWIKRLFKKRKI